MAEAWLKHFCGDSFAVESAGLEPGVLNPLVVDVMKEAGIDISHKATQSVFDLLKKKVHFDYTIAVCDGANAEKCPIFPGVSQRLHWSFPDPSQATGTREEKLAQIRIIRDTIKEKIQEWCSQVCAGPKS